MNKLLTPMSWGFQEYVFWALILVSGILLVLSISKKNWKVFTAFFSVLLSAFAFFSFFGIDLNIKSSQKDLSPQQITTIAKETAQRIAEKQLDTTLRINSSAEIGQRQLIKTIHEISKIDPKNANPIERERVKALLALHEGNFKKAEKILTQLAYDVEESKKALPKKVAEVYRQLGSVAFYNDAYRAVSAYKKATNSDPESFDGWNHLGRLYIQIGKPDLASWSFQEVLSLAKKNRDPYATVAAYDNLGNVAYSQGELEEAEKLYLEALSWIEAYGDKKVIAYPASNLGNIYADRGDLDKALKYYNMASEFISPTEKSELSGNLFMNIGNIHIKKSELTEAKRMLNKAKGIFDNIGYREGNAKLSANYGLLYAKAGEYRKAKQHFKRSIKEFLGLDNVEAARNIQQFINVIDET